MNIRLFKVALITAAMGVSSLASAAVNSLTLFGGSNNYIDNVSQTFSFSNSVGGSSNKYDVYSLNLGENINLNYNFVDFTGGPVTVNLFNTNTGIDVTTTWTSSASGNISLNQGNYFLVFSGTPTQTLFNFNANYSVAAVPEPETGAMLGLGLGLVGLITYRRKSK